MNIMNRVTWKSMWKNRTRTIVTIIGVVLSAALFTAITTLGFSLWSFLAENEVYSSGDYFLRYDYTTQAHLEELEKDRRVRSLGDLGILGYVTFTLERENGNILDETCAVAAGDRAFFDMVSVNLEEGRLPENSSEIVISRNIYHYLQQGGKPCEVGEIVELDVVPEYENASVELPADGEAFTKQYTIVGIAGLFTRLDDGNLHLSHLFTYDDENAEEALWHRAYVKTIVPTDAYKMQNDLPEGASSSVNLALLGLYGASQYNNVNLLIGGICGVLIVIIMVGSVSLIYNAFSISVSERTKQFGLLSSIGATKKQLRGSVYFEALTLSAFGIPLGILCGYWGIAATLEILKSTVGNLLSSAGGAVVLRAVPSFWMFLATGVICLVTVLLSARIPAKRATRVSPLSAIRQTQDYRIPKRGIRAGKLTQKLWGLPGLMAKKYYAVSKKKYRATVVSMTVSILLFISATSIVGIMQRVADNAVNVNNFDIRCYNLTQAELTDLRTQDFMDRTALFTNKDFVTVIPEEDQAKDYLEVYDRSADSHEFMSRCVKELNIYYLEDQVLRDHLVSLGIDPEPYFDETCPAALFFQPETTIYLTDAETGDRTRHTFKTGLVAESIETLAIYPDTVPDAVRDHIRTLMGEFYYMRNPTDEMLAFAFAPTGQLSGGIITAPNANENAVHVAVAAESDETGDTVYAYYLYDTETDTMEEVPICTVEKPEDIPEFRLGAMIDESPFGLYADNKSNVERVVMVLPLSAVWDGEGDTINLAAKINDYDAATAWLQEKQIAYDDLLASERQARDIILMINVFSYGFILLISLISVANVFNTITTNIALRRRDFGMLRSVGMKTGEMYRMIGFECLSYGGKALMWGIPMSLLINYGIQIIGSNVSNEAYALPWGTMAVVVVSVYLIVFITMYYAVTKLRKDNPIDAIRMENI